MTYTPATYPGCTHSGPGTFDVPCYDVDCPGAQAVTQ